MDKSEAWEKYADIIHLPHHVSPTRPRMSIEERGAQFSPFSALTGYDGAVRETARLTEQRMHLTDAAREELNSTLRFALEQGCRVSVTYFVQDEKKDGGSYERVSGRIKKADRYRGAIIMEDGFAIPLEDICEMQPE